MTNRCLSTSRLLGGALTAAVALLAGLSGAQAQAPAPGAPLSGAGSFPQSFIVPGTNTSLHVGGFIQIDADLRHERVRQLGLARCPRQPGAGIGRGRRQRLRRSRRGPYTITAFSATTAQNSRFLVETRTPTAYGEIKTFIEFDFAGSQSTRAAGTTVGGSTTTQTSTSTQSWRACKQAYGTLGPWLFGKANSNFADLAALSDTLDALRSRPAASWAPARSRRRRSATPTCCRRASTRRGSLEESRRRRASIGTTRSAAAAGLRVTFNNFNAPGLDAEVPGLHGDGTDRSSPGAMPASTSPWQKSRDNDRGRFAALPGHSSGGSLRALGLSAEPDRSLQHDRQGQDHLAAAVRPGRGAVHLAARTSSARSTSEDLICSATTRHIGIVRLLPAAGNGRQRRLLAFLDRRVAQRRGLRLRPGEPAERGGRLGPVPAGGNGLPRSSASTTRRASACSGRRSRACSSALEYVWYHRTVWSGAHGSANRIAGASALRRSNRHADRETNPPAARLAGSSAAGASEGVEVRLAQVSARALIGVPATCRSPRRVVDGRDASGQASATGAPARGSTVPRFSLERGGTPFQLFCPVAEHRHRWRILDLARRAPAFAGLLAQLARFIHSAFPVA